MPSYTFENTTTGQEETHFLSISEREQFIKDHPELQQKLVPVAIGDGFYYGGKTSKPDSGFRERLKEIKSHHRGSTVNTFD